MLGTQIGIVICRIGAVLLVMQSIRTLSFFFRIGDGTDSNLLRASAPYLLSGIAPLLAGIAIWVFAEKICRLGPTDRSDEAQTGIRRSELIAAGTFLLGIYVAVFGVANLMHFETLTILQGESISELSESTLQLDRHRIAMRVGQGVQILAGVALIGFGRSRH